MFAEYRIKNNKKEKEKNNNNIKGPKEENKYS
jgi:hypothetical protein